MGFIQTLGALTRRRPAPPGCDEALARIDALVSANERLEALAYAYEHAERIDAVPLWAKLERLRGEAVAEVVSKTRPRPQWPPSLPDPFPGGGAPPEIAASALTWEVMGGAILHHGSLIVRGLIDPADAARLRAGIDTALEAYDAYQQTAEASADYLPYPLSEAEPLSATRPWSRESGGVWAVEAPRAFESVLALYKARGVLEAVAGYLGERPLASIGKTVLRRAEPRGYGGFHQDGAFMGAGIRTVNVWTALSDCGEEAPGIELVARRIPYIVKTGTDGSIFDWAVGRPAAEREAQGARIVFPDFRAGDALIFDQFMLHATGIKPGMSKRRYAVESWFFAPSAYPADQMPLVI